MTTNDKIKQSIPNELSSPSSSEQTDKPTSKQEWAWQTIFSFHIWKTMPLDDQKKWRNSNMPLGGNWHDILNWIYWIYWILSNWIIAKLLHFTKWWLSMCVCNLAICLLWHTIASKKETLSSRIRLLLLCSTSTFKTVTTELNQWMQSGWISKYWNHNEQQPEPESLWKRCSQ